MDTLVTSERSPFGRICRMFMLRHQLEHKLQLIDFFNSDADRAQMDKDSPINKVPYLNLANGERIFDSRVIIEFLIRKHHLSPITITENNIISAAYSAMDVSVIFFQMRMSEYDLNADNFYMKRQHGRLTSVFEYLKPWVQKLDPNQEMDWNYASMAAFTALYWCDARAKTLVLTDHPVLLDFVKKFSHHPGVKETSFQPA